MGELQMSKLVHMHPYLRSNLVGPVVHAEDSLTPGVVLTLSTIYVDMPTAKDGMTP